MSQIQIQQPKYEKFARILETTQIYQIRGALRDGKGGGCVINVLYSAGREYRVLPYDVLDKLFHMNEKTNMTFKDMANWLREQK